jgi:hypothetical protein
MRSLRNEFAALREDLSFSRNPNGIAMEPADTPIQQVEWLRCEVRHLQKDTSDAIGGLHEEVRRCIAEAAAGTSAAKQASKASARYAEEALQINEEIGDKRLKAFEQRVHALEQAQLVHRGSPSVVQEAALEVKAQVATLERQMEHLRDLSMEASRNAEQDQATLCALLRTTRSLAGQLGVGPVLLGRESPHSHPSKGIAAEAESLAASVAAGWRRQKASGVIPPGAANILEAMHLQKSARGEGYPSAAARNTCGQGPLVSEGGGGLGDSEEILPRHCLSPGPVPLVDRVSKPVEFEHRRVHPAFT